MHVKAELGVVRRARNNGGTDGDRIRTAVAMFAHMVIL